MTNHLKLMTFTLELTDPLTAVEMPSGGWDHVSVEDGSVEFLFMRGEDDKLDALRNFEIVTIGERCSRDARRFVARLDSTRVLYERFQESPMREYR